MNASSMDFTWSTMIAHMKIGERIQIARKYANLSQAKLASLIGVKRQAVHSMENGQTKKPQPDNLYNIARVTKVNHEWLLFGRGDMRDGMDIADSPSLQNKKQDNGYRLRRIAMLNDEEAIDWQENYLPELKEGLSSNHFYVNYDAPERVFGMFMRGDTMTCQGPISIPDGSVVVIDPDREPFDGAIVAAHQGKGKVLIKQLVMDGPNKYLASLNKQYSPISMDESFEIIGVVYQSSQTTMHV